MWEHINGMRITCLAASSCKLVACWASVACCSWHFNVSISRCDPVLAVQLGLSRVDWSTLLPLSALALDSWPAADEEACCRSDTLSSSDCRRSISSCHQHTHIYTHSVTHCVRVPTILCYRNPRTFSGPSRTLMPHSKEQLSTVVYISLSLSVLTAIFQVNLS